LFFVLHSSFFNGSWNTGSSIMEVGSLKEELPDKIEERRRKKEISQ